MATLMETVNAAAQQKTNIRLSRCKEVKRMNISASIDAKKSDNFHLVRAKVSKLPMLFASGCKEDGPVIVDRNFARMGKIDCAFVPKIVILSGRTTLKAAKENGDRFIRVWAGDAAIKSLNISAADSISNSDLEQKLTQLIRDAYVIKKGTSKSDSACDVSYDMYPYLRDVFQGDNYCIFQLQKAMYKQAYKVDAVNRNVTLVGNKIQVFQTYTPAPAGDVSSSSSPIKIKAASTRLTATPSFADSAPSTDSNWPMSSPNKGFAPAMGGFNGPAMNQFEVQLTTFGAPNSELNNPQYKMMLNVEDALSQYLTVLKNGMHKPVSMAGLTTLPSYVNAAREVNIALKAAKNVPKTFSTMDFIKWQDKTMSIKASQQTKMVDGEVRIASDFAYVGDPRDISTWHLPIASAADVKKSLKIMASASAIPKFEREEAQALVRRTAKHFGIKG